MIEDRTNTDEFDARFKADSDTAKPVYTKEKLDPMLTADYAAFESFTKDYSFESLTK